MSVFAAIISTCVVSVRLSESSIQNTQKVNTISIINAKLKTSNRDTLATSKNKVIEDKVSERKIIQVEDDQVFWQTVQDINLFENSLYGNSGIIAPGTHGEYVFEIENLSNSEVTYQIGIRENKDTQHVNLEYCLKSENHNNLENSQEWVSSSQMRTQKFNLSAKEKETYQLLWQWPFESGRDKVDTLAGVEAVGNKGNYRTTILIQAELETKFKETKEVMNSAKTEVVKTEAVKTGDPNNTIILVILMIASGKVLLLGKENFRKRSKWDE